MAHGFEESFPLHVVELWFSSLIVPTAVATDASNCRADVVVGAAAAAFRKIVQGRVVVVNDKPWLKQRSIEQDHEV